MKPRRPKSLEYMLYMKMSKDVVSSFGKAIGRSEGNLSFASNLKSKIFKHLNFSIDYSYLF